MSGSARLRELLAATTPGPWSSAGTHVHRGERFTETHEPIAVAHTEEADARREEILRIKDDSLVQRALL